MHNPKETIAASEINKYIHCPYQWYYERFYGAACLREKYKERNELLGQEDTTYSNFRKGLAFHESFGRMRAVAFFFRVLALTALVALALLIGYSIYNGIAL